MATDTSLLMGEVIEDPQGQQKDVEILLVGFLKALIAEQIVQNPNDIILEEK
jgi:hypothetical protein